MRAKTHIPTGTYVCGSLGNNEHCRILGFDNGPSKRIVSIHASIIISIPAHPPNAQTKVILTTKKQLIFLIFITFYRVHFHSTIMLRPDMILYHIWYLSIILVENPVEFIAHFPPLYPEYHIILAEGPGFGLYFLIQFMDKWVQLLSEFERWKIYFSLGKIKFFFPNQRKCYYLAVEKMLDEKKSWAGEKWQNYISVWGNWSDSGVKCEGWIENPFADYTVDLLDK